jgi:hypothetical protein
VDETTGNICYISEPVFIRGSSIGFGNYQPDTTVVDSVLFNHIGEVTAAHGVVIDGVTLKDGGATIVTGGTNTFNITNGTASFDVAAGVVVNVDAELHVTAATHLDEAVSMSSKAPIASPTFTGTVTAPILNSVSDTTGSIATATPTTIFTAAQYGVYILSAFVGGVGATATASCYVIDRVVHDLIKGANMNISMSTNDVQVTQSTGGNAAVLWVSLRLR